MVYRLALACGAPPDFRRRMIEITPVIGGAVVWRQIAGALVGLVPGYGIVPKTAVAFGGTYVVGLAATRWYETGLLTDAERKRITAEAAVKARDVAKVMVDAGARRRRQGRRAGAGRVAGGQAGRRDCPVQGRQGGRRRAEDGRHRGRQGRRAGARRGARSA